MKATQAFGDEFLSKRCFGRETLRGCSTKGKRDNIVLIEVDCDDLGNVIILDVPESFQEKFRKNPEHNVIKIDDEDSDDSKGGVSDMDIDASTSNRASPTTRVPSANCANINSSENNGFPHASAACSSNCADVDGDCSFVKEGNIPVKLSKSKRTYSGKTVSGNEYGSDSENLSEGDCSDCEFMEDSYGKLREQWEKAFYRRRHGTSCRPSDATNRAGSSGENQSGQSDEGVADHLESTSQSDLCAVNRESNVSSLAEECKFFQEERNKIFTGRHDNSSDGSDFEKKDGNCAPDQFGHGNFESAAEHVDCPGESSFRSPDNHDGYVPFDDSTKHPTGQSRCSLHDCNAADQEAGRSTMLPETSICGQKSESETYINQNSIITDRQIFKETDEYKRAMEEEWASRQQQLKCQAEEAQRLRSRKRAAKMRLMDNERRQRQRVEEIRETRRKEEENTNLKDVLRAEVKKELCRLELVCGDMASLLRLLGIQVGGGLCPSPVEVQAAYKRACLKFHPDRSSSTDLRQQVEAEEKFKLISNMKEKFSMK